MSALKLMGHGIVPGLRGGHPGQGDVTETRVQAESQAFLRSQHFAHQRPLGPPADVRVGVGRTPLEPALGRGGTSGVLGGWVNRRAGWGGRPFKVTRAINPRKWSNDMVINTLISYSSCCPAWGATQRSSPPGHTWSSPTSLKPRHH